MEQSGLVYVGAIIVLAVAVILVLVFIGNRFTPWQPRPIVSITGDLTSSTLKVNGDGYDTGALEGNSILIKDETTNNVTTLISSDGTLKWDGHDLLEGNALFEQNVPVDLIAEDAPLSDCVAIFNDTLNKLKERGVFVR